jgi:hypothetical protein
MTGSVGISIGGGSVAVGSGASVGRDVGRGVRVGTPPSPSAPLRAGVGIALVVRAVGASLVAGDPQAASVKSRQVLSSRLRRFISSPIRFVKRYLLHFCLIVKLL